ncbi:hypothetical protein ART_2040 [Arthrobacter sp. PAMC 25486]|nr:hypothetical protein ART_2040 [Arthrobacter sp. PAMC 25486]
MNFRLGHEGSLAGVEPFWGVHPMACSVITKLACALLTV